jgi:hypothetical protein
LELIKTGLHERKSCKDVLEDVELGTQQRVFPGLPTLPFAPGGVFTDTFKRIVKIIHRSKNHPDYNESIDKNFGIIGAEKQ